MLIPQYCKSERSQHTDGDGSGLEKPVNTGQRRTLDFEVFWTTPSTIGPVFTIIVFRLGIDAWL